MKPNLTVLFDCNSWISFSMTNSQLRQIEKLFLLSNIQILSCQGLLEEFERVVKKPKLEKYLILERVEIARFVLQESLLPLEIPANFPQISRDPKDDYMLHFAAKYALDYIVTGDKDLLVLEKYGLTQIITFNEFMSILEGKGLI